MIPQGTPEARCSAALADPRESRRRPSMPSASATATSSAALDDRPVPIGIVVDTSPTKPTAGRISATTPAT